MRDHLPGKEAAQKKYPNRQKHFFSILCKLG
jgi:hypothetical protein